MRVATDSFCFIVDRIISSGAVKFYTKVINQEEDMEVIKEDGISDDKYIKVKVKGKFQRKAQDRLIKVLKNNKMSVRFYNIPEKETFIYNGIHFKKESKYKASHCQIMEGDERVHDTIEKCE